MIKLSGNAGRTIRRPWRRRISNQLAAVAAIMLFASTQVTAPQQYDGAQTAGAASPPTVPAQQEDTVFAATQGEGSTAPIATHSVSTGAKKNERFKLSILLLGR